MYDTALDLRECPEQDLHSCVAQVVVVQVDMREHGHLCDPRQAREVHGPDIQVLQVHGGRDREGVGHIDLARHAHTMPVLHDVSVLQLHLVLPIQRTEAAMQALRIDVVHVERPCRSGIAARRLTRASSLGSLLLQLPLHEAECIDCHMARPLAARHGTQHRMIALQEDLLAAVHAGRHGESELRGDGAGLEEALRRFEVGLDGRGDVCYGVRRWKRAVVAHRGHGEGPVVASNRRPGPGSQRLGRAVRLEVRRHDNVHVAVGYVREEVEDAREEVHITLRKSRKPGLMLTLPSTIAGGKTHEATEDQRRAIGAAPCASRANGGLQSLQVHTVDQLQGAAQRGCGCSVSCHVAHMMDKVQELVGRSGSQACTGAHAQLLQAVPQARAHGGVLQCVAEVCYGGVGDLCIVREVNLDQATQRGPASSCRANGCSLLTCEVAQHDTEPPEAYICETSALQLELPPGTVLRNRKKGSKRPEVQPRHSAEWEVVPLDVGRQFQHTAAFRRIAELDQLAEREAIEANQARRHLCHGLKQQSGSSARQPQV
mmetsp:Transcript_118924/g.348274  ORF Transcript_118924/g.348274 Transcript_118924/m.348274 type:complete len:544 (+) Transcript_118924:719-2350(+)